MKRFDDMAEKLDGDQRLAVLRAKDRALKQANDQADEQFMDANQKLANRMAELQESMKKAQAAGDMAGVNRFQAALGIEAKKIAALGTRQQGSSLATLNNYGPSSRVGYGQQVRCRQIQRGLGQAQHDQRADRQGCQAHG